MPGATCCCRGRADPCARRPIARRVTTTTRARIPARRQRWRWVIRSARTLISKISRIGGNRARSRGWSSGERAGPLRPFAVMVQALSDAMTQPSDSILPNSILIVDFGSQVTQLIARRVRVAGVYSEIAPIQSAEAAFERMRPRGVILSGSPASVLEDDSPRIPQAILNSRLPGMGICYGQQAMMHQLGGTVELGDSGEFGRAFIEIDDGCELFGGLWVEGETHLVWMSHGD